MFKAFWCGGASSTCTLELVFFLYKVGESLLDATIRPYIIQATCLNMKPLGNGSVCENLGFFPETEDAVQHFAATYIMLHRIVLYTPAIFLGLFFGAWSDKHGRKLPIIFPSMGSIIGVLFYIGSLMEKRWNMYMIITGGFLQGALGKSSVITMAVHSYAADITENEHRTKKMGKILSMNFFGLFAGSLLSGLLADAVGIEVMFSLVSVFHAAAILTTVFFLVETVTYVKAKDSEDTTFKISSFFNFSNIKDSLMVLFRKRDDGTRGIIFTIFLISVLQIACKTGEMDTTVLFVQHRPLSWTKSGYGFLLSIDYAVMGICLLFILPLLSNVIKISDTTIIMVAIFCKVVRLIWAAFLNKSWMMYVSIGLGAMGGLMISALRSLLSKTVSEYEIGKTFSLLGCGETASKLLGTAIFTNIYSATAKFMPGMVYLVEAAIFFSTLLLMIWVTFRLKTVMKYRLLDDSSPKKNYNSQDTPDVPFSNLGLPQSHSKDGKYHLNTFRFALR
uniref:Major facilitator superfamily (MFS) profile domain-containing protein n=1 Tax=Octopus bimaculoides TaxID=37653 RepID=A0A0L8GN57_OCTBM